MQICDDAGGGRSLKRGISAEYVRLSNRANVSVECEASALLTDCLSGFSSVCSKTDDTCESPWILSEMMENMTA